MKTSASMQKETQPLTILSIDFRTRGELAAPIVGGGTRGSRDIVVCDSSLRARCQNMSLSIRKG